MALRRCDVLRSHTGASEGAAARPTAGASGLIIVDPSPRRVPVIFTDADRRRVEALGRVAWHAGGAERMPDSEVDRLLPECVVLVGQTDLPKERLDRAPRLRAVLNVEGNFMPNVDYAECARRGIHVATCAPAFAPAVAEHSLGVAIAAARGIVDGDARMRNGTEVYGGASTEGCFMLTGKTLGVIGLGNLGRCLLPLLAPYKATLLGHDPWQPDAALRALGVEPAGMQELFARSDVVFIMAAATTENEGQIGAPLFRSMRRGAVVVLASRAHIVDMDALLDAAADGHLKAAVDVWPHEPLPPGHRARSTPNTVISAHRAGGMQAVYYNIGRMVADDAERVVRGEAPAAMMLGDPARIAKIRSKPIGTGGQWGQQGAPAPAHGPADPAPRVFVTGPTGCIGAALVRWLQREGAAVIGYSRHAAFDRLGGSPGGMHFITGDLADGAALRAALRAARPTHVVHLASPQTPFCNANPLEGMRVSVEGTGLLLRALQAECAPGQLQRVVYASSGAVYATRGFYKTPTVTPDLELRPVNHYGRWKQAGEAMTRAFHEETKVPAVSLRLASTYGPGRDAGLTSAPTSLLKALAAGRAYEWQYRGRECYHWVHDMGAAFGAAALHPFDSYGAFNLPGTTVEADDFMALAVTEARRRGLDTARVGFAAGAAPNTFVCDLDAATFRAQFPKAPLTPLADGIASALGTFVSWAREGKDF